MPALQAGAVNASAEEYRPRILPLAGLMYEMAILAFPLVAGAIITTVGYTAVLIVLLGFAVAVASLGFRHSMATPVVRRALTPGVLAGAAELDEE